MNSFETDMRRAVCNMNFVIGALIEIFILRKCSINDDIFIMSIPIIATLPYSTSWINDYKSGFIKEYLPRCGLMSYIAGRYMACSISGGAVVGVAAWIYSLGKEGKASGINVVLIFVSGMLWAAVATTLSAVSGSRYIAYGGSFVIFYVLVIMYERYFDELYCLYPEEWFMPKHDWVFGQNGIIIMCAGIMVILFFIYYWVLKHHIKRI
jgi:hypothetical protein